MFLIKQEHDKCIACGSCVSVCEENWEIASDGKGKPKKTKLEKIGCNKQAAELCPAKCITIKIIS